MFQHSEGKTLTLFTSDHSLRLIWKVSGLELRKYHYRKHIEHLL